MQKVGRALRKEVYIKKCTKEECVEQGCKNWISNQRQECGASQGQERCVTNLGRLFQGNAKPKGK